MISRSLDSSGVLASAQSDSRNDACPQRPTTQERVLVTGGAGFVGSWLVDRLIGIGASVTVLDNFLTGSLENLAHFAGHPRLRIIEGDVTKTLDRFTGPWTRIYNLACPASPVHYQRHPIETLLASTSGMVNVLELARRSGARVLQASTSEIYGDPEVHPQRETYAGNVHTLGPRSCYDEGKRVAETLSYEYDRVHGVDVRIARIFNTYGPRMAIDDGRVVSDFIVAALQGRALVIHGDGSQTRSFCYVDDLVDGLIRLMEANSIAGPVNLGRPEEVTIRELADAVLERTGSTAGIQFVPCGKDDPRRRRPAIDRAREWLGWDPRISLAEGLERTIESFREAVRLIDSDHFPQGRRWVTENLVEDLQALLPNSRIDNGSAGAQCVNADPDPRRSADQTLFGTLPMEYPA
jgi:UDP-glucuronate decarboxylase